MDKVISNVKVYGLAESIYRSGYPMLSAPPTENEFKTNINIIDRDISYADYENVHIKRAINLAKAKGGGHDQFLTGIIVQFDLAFSNKAWVEAERYTFLNFISSMSTMHRIANFDIKQCCNEYVTDTTIQEVNRLKEEYLLEENDEKKKEAFLKLIYNLPSGLIIVAGMSTNYRCLKNVYAQRKTHRLPDWKTFCPMIKELPLAKELITFE